MMGPDISDRGLTGYSKACLAGKLDCSSCDDVDTADDSAKQAPHDEEATMSEPADKVTTEQFHTKTALEGVEPAHQPIRARPHIIFDGAAKVAPLAHYILLAEQACFRSAAPARRKVFCDNPHGRAPTLRDDGENRIMIYPGCFNPPHLGHTGLLWHTYLCVDKKTIAAITALLFTGSFARKEMTSCNGRQFMLTHHQRTQLLQDPVLSQYVWVYPREEWELVEQFYQTLEQVCGKDGFKVSLPSLHGGDNFEGFRQTGYMGWDSGSIITSDVGRPVDFVSNDCDGDVLPNCKKWKKMASGSERHSGDWRECTSFWPCMKLRAIYPEFFDQDLECECGVLSDGMFS